MSINSSQSGENTPLIARPKPRRANTLINKARTKVQPGSPLRYGSVQEFLRYKQPNSLTWGDDFSSQASVPKTSADECCGPKVWSRDPNKVIDTWVDKGKKPTFRQKVAFFVDTSRLGRFWDLLDTVLNFFLVCLYIWNTRHVRIDSKTQPLPHGLFLLEWGLSFFLFLQSLPRIYISADMLDYLLSPFSLVNLASVLPPILVPVIDHFSEDMDLSHTYMAAGFMVYIYPFRFLRLHMSFCRILLPVRNSLFNFSLIVKKTLYLCSTILFTIIFVSAWIHIVTYKFYEDNEELKSITFFDAFFFTTISSTSGFNSNLVPDSTFNRFVILFIMISGALFLPGKISELLALINKRSAFDHFFEPEKNQQHVIVCGNFDNNSLFEFLREFFCEDHGPQTMNTNVVVLNSAEPSEELVAILSDPVYSARVQYVKGLPTSYKSLRKVRAGVAKACFVFTNKNSSDDRESDATAVMLALAIKRYNKGLRLYAQVNLPENKPHFDNLARQLVCIQELRLGMLAQNLLNPGFSTLIYLLATSMTNATYDELSIGIQLSPEMPWLKEYVHGATHEIYSIQLASCFCGMTFIAVAETIYKHFGATLFAMNLPNPNIPHISKSNILLNPFNYIIKGGEDGFIMSCSAYDANRISRLGEEGNTLKEFASIFEEDMSDYLNEGLSEEPPSFDSSIALPMLKQSSTKDSGASELAEVPKRPLVLQLDGNSSDDNSSAEPMPGISGVISPSEKETSQSGPSLSLQERNINKVISEMVKENSYFSALNELTEVTGHVVICDASPSFPRSMEYFVGTFRAPHLTEKLPIVILTMVPPSDGQRHVLGQFGDVHFLCGSPLSRKALFSAGVSRASKAVVLCHDTASTRGSERTVDATSLLTVLNMESMALDPDFFVVVEFIYRENMKLVGAGETISSSEKYSQALLRPAFMSGHVAVPCMLEPLICQAYYNDNFLAVVDRLVFDLSLDQWRRSGDIGEGGAPTPFLANPSSQDSYSSLSHVFTFNVPVVFYSRPYFHLFSWLLREKAAVTLGIYRTRNFQNRQLSYVITNPQPDLLLMDLDKAYVVAQKCP